MYSLAYLTVSRKVAPARTITPWSPLRTPLQVLLHRSAPPLALSEQQPLPGTAVRFTGAWTKSLETLDSTTLIRNCSPPLPSQSLSANYESGNIWFGYMPPKKTQTTALCKIQSETEKLPTAKEGKRVLCSRHDSCCFVLSKKNDPPNAIPNSGHLRYPKTQNSPQGWRG